MGWKGQNNAYLLHPPSPPGHMLAPHNASVVTVPADKPPRDKPQKLKYPGRPLLCPPPKATRSVQIGDYNLMILTETEIRDAVYSRNRMG